MKRNLLLLPILLLALCPLLPAQSNLFIDDSYTLEEMVADFFDNPNVVTSNIVYTGDPGSVAFFEADDTNLGLNAGIVFTSGFTSSLADASDGGATSGNSTGSGDSDLSDLGNGTSNDAAIIEFDFTISVSDTFHFNYVFGSEEYPEYACSGFNDAFGFLVSGPGISGPYSNGAENITTIPGTDIVVSINNVNDNSACGPPNAEQYYVNNTGDPHIEFDGLTTALPASFYAVGGETYHAKLVVGDMGDAIYDSGIFLSFNSLGSDSLLVPPSNFEYSVTGTTIDFTNTSKYAREWFWDFGYTNTSTERNPPAFTYNYPGTYIISLTTQNFCCTDTYYALIEVEGTSAITANVEVQNNPVACNGDQNAIISINPDGGTGPYNIFWFPGIPNLNNVAPGQYSYLITDDAGNGLNGVVVITEPEAFNLEMSATDEMNGQADGTATASVTGGVAPYTYLWSNGGTTATIENLTAGSYTVTITDANTCTSTSTVSVNSTILPISISIETTNNPLACFGDQNASVEIVIMGGIPPFATTWEPMGTDPSALSAGSYTYVITDSFGNSLAGELIITEPNEAILDMSSTPAINTQSDGTAAVATTGGTAPYAYLWSNGATSPTATNLLAGTYTVTVTDANECTYVNSVEVEMSTSVFETDMAFDLMIFPNPVKDYMFLQNIKGIAVKQMNLINMLGESFETSYREKIGVVEVDLSKSLVAGVYIVRIQWVDGSWSIGRFVKS